MIPSLAANLSPDDLRKAVAALPPDKAAELDFHFKFGVDLSRYRDDPALYSSEVLRVKWWSKQAEIARSVRDNRRTVVYSGHSTGKSHCLAGIAQWHFDCFAPSITLTSAPTWSSVNDILWGEIRQQRPPNTRGRLSQLRLYGGPMHYLKGHNADSGESFQGRHEGRVLIVLDEAMGLPLYVWEASNSMMTSPGCRLIAAGNPTETSGPFYEIRSDPNYAVFSLSCLEHPNIAAELAGTILPIPRAVSLTWVREMLASHTQRAAPPDADSFEFPPGSGEWYNGDDVFLSRVLGQFPRQSASAVWSDAWLDLARENQLQWSKDSLPEVGVDVARFGDDLTTIYARRGPCLLESEEYSKQGTMDTVGRVREMADRLGKEYELNSTQFALKVDDTGVGGGVTDRLREMGYRAIPVVAGGHPVIDAEQFYNRRSELWFTTAYLGRDRRLDLTRMRDDHWRKLSAELKSVRYKIQSDRRLRVEAKEDYKKRVGRSPDHADGFNLAFGPGRELGLGFV